MMVEPASTAGRLTPMHIGVSGSRPLPKRDCAGYLYWVRGSSQALGVNTFYYGEVIVPELISPNWREGLQCNASKTT